MVEALDTAVDIGLDIRSGLRSFVFDRSIFDNKSRLHRDQYLYTAGALLDFASAGGEHRRHLPQRNLIFLSQRSIPKFQHGEHG